MEAMVEQVKVTRSASRPAKPQGDRTSFRGRCEAVRDGHDGRVIVVADARGAMRVAWRGPLLDGEVAMDDHLEVVGTHAGGYVRAQRIVNLTQGTVLRPVPRALRQAAKGALAAVAISAALLVVAALTLVLL